MFTRQAGEALLARGQAPGARQQVAIGQLKTWVARTMTTEALDQVFDLLPTACPSPRLRGMRIAVVDREGVFA
jgi:hypothetical protein